MTAAPSPAAWDHPKVAALAKALSEAEMFYDDRDWLVLAETALIHLGLMEWVTETTPAREPSAMHAAPTDESGRYQLLDQPTGDHHE